MNNTTSKYDGMGPAEANARAIADGEIVINETIPIDDAQLAMVWAVTEIERLRAYEHRVGMLDVLTDGPGHLVQIVKVTAEWTDWRPKDIEGDTLDDCLAKAIRLMADCS